jgi:hypothetical protein
VEGLHVFTFNQIAETEAWLSDLRQRLAADRWEYCSINLPVPVPCQQGATKITISVIVKGKGDVRPL